MPRQTNGDLILSDKPAWGKLNEGQRYGILADDVSCLIARAGFNKAEATLLNEVRIRSWGESARRKRPGRPWPDAKPAQINFHELARQLNPDPSQAESQRRLMMRAKRDLIRDRIIIETPEGLTINKQAEEWARLTRADLDYAASKITPQGGPIDHPPSDQSVTLPVTNRSLQGGPIGHSSSDQSVTPPLKGTRTSEISEDSRRHLTVCETGEAHTDSYLSPEEEAEAEREKRQFQAWLAREEARNGHASE